MISDWHNQVQLNARKYLEEEVYVSEKLEPLELLTLFNERQDELIYFNVSFDKVSKEKSKHFENSMMDQFFKLYVASTVMSKAEKVIRNSGFEPLSTEHDEQFSM